MECVQKQCPTHPVAKSAPVRIKAQGNSKQIEVCDKASAEFPSHFASEKAVCDLKHRVVLCATVTPRMTFIL